ncbi:DUF2947 domain-containing protein [Pseudoalteromonas sp. JBTF-M23]|uniref:DUF2947 domain-containing protein n=1 Tax=Pseudoalteromonas caenipelagi TaxID=2726988 RepID=A0A849VIV6_9GAMM|nr:DUF2947 family protein [Pseudoalteromonas caenipelagi]NOU51661.1 DUF2947 domain-containing protein [Pseudoalteromonas caenipelagi]
MNYISIDKFKKAWVFKHQDLPINEADLDAIKLMSPERSAVLWTTMVSREKDHPDFFTKSEWPGDEATWVSQLNWETPWENGEPHLPQTLCDFLQWEDNTTVYFCLSREHVFETRFDVFKHCWQNFMFLADGSLLLGKKRQGVVQFMENGQAKLGERPKS